MPGSPSETLVSESKTETADFSRPNSSFEGQTDHSRTAPSEGLASGAKGDAPTSISRLRFLVNLVVSVSILGLSVYGYTFLGERTRPQRKKPPKSPFTVVSTSDLREHRGPVQIDVNGVVVPLRELRLATEVAGRAVELSRNVRAGRSVASGEVLLKLDATEYELEVKRLKALSKQEAAEEDAVRVSIENTRELQTLAEKQLEIANQETKRVRALVDQRAASASEVDTARRAELAANAELVTLQNQLREQAAQLQLVIEKRQLTGVLLERAELDLSRCVVRSPIDGRVVSSAVEEQSFVPMGTTFVTVEDTSAVEVRASLTADQMFWIWNSRSTADDPILDSGESFETSSPEGRESGVTVPAIVSCELGNERHRWSAVFERLDGVGIDPNTRTYPCLFRVEAPLSKSDSDLERPLTRGMFVNVSIETNPNRKLLRVSETAVRPGNRLWLSLEGKLRIVPVSVVSRIGDEVVVQMQIAREHLDAFAEAKIIVSPISDPVEGMPVGSATDAAGSGKRDDGVATKSAAKQDSASVNPLGIASQVAG
ncbi:efflux RND transporter periplasmic adaptor subunit [Rhodopirellula halodulae]|uniref:efflux RND transporter periplasmic adaptor subunit n=1 Tax=Rhodopirellula halodulae TaxID=2894198 RepID=UPI001E49E0EA|nr:HlyD family efflux transporter periplasmic adaptor subunit [Rhodopirellula sp. JC737]MCC9658227.1 HlyD family efflux transporter periplasmic adaptor subunit [Rhodopirellula sp. JC737]